MVCALSSRREMGMKKREGSGQGRQATKKASPPATTRFPQATPVPHPSQPRGCKGRSPLPEITLVSPFPPGRGSGGWGRQSKLKTAAAGNQEGKPPLSTCKAESAGGKESKPPAVSRFPQANPVPHPTQPRGCKGRSPLHEITLVSPFPPGRGSGGWGRESKLKAASAGDKDGKPPP